MIRKKVAICVCCVVSIADSCQRNESFGNAGGPLSHVPTDYDGCFSGLF